VVAGSLVGAASVGVWDLSPPAGALLLRRFEVPGLVSMVAHLGTLFAASLRPEPEVPEVPEVPEAGGVEAAVEKWDLGLGLLLYPLPLGLIIAHMSIYGNNH